MDFPYFLFPTRYSLLTTPESLLPTHYSLFATPYLLLSPPSPTTETETASAPARELPAEELIGKIGRENHL